MKEKTAKVPERIQIGKVFISEKENFRNSLEMSPFGIEIIKTKGELVYINPAMLRFWGYETYEELKAVPKEQRFTPDTIAIISEKINGNAGHLVPSRQELTIIRKDGRQKLLLGYDFEILWDGERCIQVIYEDITEEKSIGIELKKEQENFRNSIENSPLGIQIIDPNGTMIYANRTLVNIWGYSSFEELKNVPRTRRFTLESLKKVKNLRGRRMKGNILPQHEISIIRKDGQMKVLHGYNAEILWNGIWCSEIIYEDVTEQRQTEEKLKIEQENFRNTIEMSPLGMMIIRLNGELAYANKAMVDLYGYDSFDELKKTPREKRLTTDSIITISEVNKGRSERHPPLQYDITVICKDGQKKDLHAYNKEIMWNDELCAQVLYEDVTLQRQIEEKLKKEQENFRRSIEESPYGIQIVKFGKELVFVNRAMLTIWGYESLEELKHTTMKRRYSEDSLIAIDKINKDYLQGHIPPQVDVSIICKNGQNRYLRGNHADIIWDGELCAQTTFEDITIQIQIEEKLRKEQENFRNSIEMSPLGVQIVTDKGILVWANKTMLEMWGYASVRELVNTPLEQRYTPESVATIKLRIAREPSRQHRNL